MKKISAVLMILVLLLSVSCATTAQEEAAKATIVVLSAPAEAGDIATVPALAASEIIRQDFNATEWWPAYSIKTIVEEDFWFQPAPQTIGATGAVDDTYLDNAPYSEKPTVTTRVFTDKYIAFMKDTAGKYEYDILVGEGQSASYQCWYQCFSELGSEIIIYAPYDYALSGLVLRPIATGKQMLEAANYIVTDVNGKTYTLSVADVEASTVKNMGTSIAIDTPQGLIENAYAIAPEGVTAASAPVEGKIMRGVFALGAKSVYGKEPNALGNVKGTYYNGIQIDALLAQYGAEVAVAGKIVAADGEFAKEDLAAQRIIHHKTNGFVTLKQYQLKSNTEDAVYATEYILFDNAAIVCAEGKTLADVIAVAAFEAPVKAVVEYADGTTAEVTDFAAVALDASVAAVKLF